MILSEISVVSTVISATACIIAIISCIVSSCFATKSAESSRDARYHEERANSIAMGQSESSLYNNIAQSRTLIGEVSAEIAKLAKENGGSIENLDEPNKKFLAVLEKNFNCHVENYLNMYEVACGLYLDAKIDINRFKSTYLDDIKNLCEKDAYRKQIQLENTSKYESIWKVYHKFMKKQNI